MQYGGVEMWDAGLGYSQGCGVHDGVGMPAGIWDAGLGYGQGCGIEGLGIQALSWLSQEYDREENTALLGLYHRKKKNPNKPQPEEVAPG